MAFRALPPLAYGAALAGLAGWRIKRDVRKHVQWLTRIEDPEFKNFYMYAEDLGLWGAMGLAADDIIIRETFEPAATLEEFARTALCRPQRIILQNWYRKEPVPVLPGYWHASEAWYVGRQCEFSPEHRYRRVNTYRTAGRRVTP